MRTLADYLQRGREQIVKLAAIFDAEPEFSKWAASHLDMPLFSLLQFFPADRADFGKAEESAIKIARAFGGSWTRQADGSWKGNAGEWTIILHNVERPVVNGPDIDLSDPVCVAAAAH